MDEHFVYLKALGNNSFKTHPGQVWREWILVYLQTGAFMK